MLFVGFSSSFNSKAKLLFGEQISFTPVQGQRYQITAVGEFKRLPLVAFGTKYLLCPEGFKPNKLVQYDHIIRCGMGAGCNFTLSSVGAFGPENNKAMLAINDRGGIINAEFATEFAQELAFESHSGFGLYENIIFEAVKVICKK